jgi:hypothetical protein
MATQAAPSHSPERTARPHVVYHPGDLVTTAQGYPVLYEVLTVEPGGLLRVRGVNWAPGYSATVGTDAVRPVTGILARKA